MGAVLWWIKAFPPREEWPLIFWPSPLRHDAVKPKSIPHSKVKTEWIIFFPHPCLFFPLFLSAETGKSLWIPQMCNTKAQQKRRYGGRWAWQERRRDWSQGPTLAPHSRKHQNHSALLWVKLMQVHNSQGCSGTFPGGAYFSWQSCEKDENSLRKRPLWFLSHKLSTCKYGFCIPSHSLFITSLQRLKAHHMPGCVPDMQFLPHAGRYANSPAPSGALCKFTFLKKTLSPRYFRQRKILGERLSEAWSVETVYLEGVRLGLEGGTEGIHTGWEHMENNSGKQSCAQRSYWGFGTGLSSSWPWELKGVKITDLWKTSASEWVLHWGEFRSPTVLLVKKKKSESGGSQGKKE